jgi:hypothetical protein
MHGSRTPLVPSSPIVAVGRTPRPTTSLRDRVDSLEHHMIGLSHHLEGIRCPAEAAAVRGEIRMLRRIRDGLPKAA